MSGHQFLRSSRRRLFLALALGSYMAAFAVALFGCARATAAPPKAGPSAQAADAFLVVDCLLPGQIRRLGSQVTYLTPRRAAKTTARDCEIRGGEYVSYDRSDYKTALKVWMDAAQQGDLKAQTYVGEIYEKGLGVPPDYPAAAQWYRRAAEKGYAPAAFNLGVLYENGRGVPRDPKEAAEWYRRATGVGPVTFDVGQGVGRANVAQLEAQLETLRSELQGKEADLKRTQQSLEDVRKSMDQRQNEVQVARSELERLRRERADLQAKDQPAAARLSALQRAIDESEARVKNSEREASTLKERLGRAQNEASRQQADKDREVQTLRDRLARAEGEIQAQRAGLESLQRQRDQAGPEIELTQIQLLEPQLTALTRDIRVQPTAGSTGGSALSLLLAGRVRAADGVQSLTVNGREEALDKDGIFKVRVPVKGTQEERVRLVAVDRGGRKAMLEMIVPGRVQLPGVAAAATGEGRGLPALERSALSLGTYHALVIGNNTYSRFKPLRTAVADAEAVAALLRDRYGFKVKLLRNATRLQILSELNELRERLTEKDNLLIYYAGHGDLDQKNQRGYWLPIDAEPGNTANWISNIDVSDLTNLMAVKHLLIVSDSCYAATLTRSSTGRLEPAMTQEELTRAVQTLAGKRARMVMTSGGIEPVLDSAGGPHSVFAQTFLEVLEANDGVMLGRDVFRQLQLRVHALAQRWEVPQVPEYAPMKYAGHEGGDFFFLKTGS
jgi:TPR repeat protein